MLEKLGKDILHPVVKLIPLTLRERQFVVEVAGQCAGSAANFHQHDFRACAVEHQARDNAFVFSATRSFLERRVRFLNLL